MPRCVPHVATPVRLLAAAAQLHCCIWYVCISDVLFTADSSVQGIDTMCTSVKLAAQILAAAGDQQTFFFFFFFNKNKGNEGNVFFTADSTCAGH